MNTGNWFPVGRALGAHGLAGKVKLITTDLFAEMSPYFQKGIITASIYQQPHRQGQMAVRMMADHLTNKVPLPPTVHLSPGVVMSSNLQLFREIRLPGVRLNESALPTRGSTRHRGPVRCVAGRGPGLGDRRKAMLGDSSILTGGQVISEEVGLKLETAGLDLLGKARKVVVTKDETTIVEGAGEADQIAGRVNQIRAEIDKSAPDYDRDKPQERLPRLARGVAGPTGAAAPEGRPPQPKPPPHAAPPPGL